MTSSREHEDQQPMTYASSGVNYDMLDPVKRAAQLEARKTSKNLERLGFKAVEASRGESAFVTDIGEMYIASMIEGLGTEDKVADEFVKAAKNQAAIADQLGRATNRTYYDVLGWNTMSAIFNDIITVGADPAVSNVYWAVGKSDWFSDEQRRNDLVRGTREAVDFVGATWGGGETPSLKDVVDPEAIDLAGDAWGIIRPKERLTLGQNLRAGDAILLVESSGAHINGVTLMRDIAAKIAGERETSLAEAYTTPLSDGQMYGEAILKPVHLYAGMVRDMFDAGVDIHYMSNITGHGWRKIMRSEKPFTYNIDRIPEVKPIFKFIQEESRNDDREMYGNYNMGAGFAVFLPQEQVSQAQRIAFNNYGFDSINAGTVQEGPKRLIINPINLTFEGSTLAVR